MVVQLVAQIYIGHANPTPGVLFGIQYIPLVRPLAWIDITGEEFREVLSSVEIIYVSDRWVPCA